MILVGPHPDRASERQCLLQGAHSRGLPRNVSVILSKLSSRKLRNVDFYCVSSHIHSFGWAYLYTPRSGHLSVGIKLSARLLNISMPPCY
jgi:hypothetical protein